LSVQCPEGADPGFCCARHGQQARLKVDIPPFRSSTTPNPPTQPLFLRCPPHEASSNTDGRRRLHTLTRLVHHHGGRLGRGEILRARLAHAGTTRELGPVALRSNHSIATIVSFCVLSFAFLPARFHFRYPVLLTPFCFSPGRYRASSRARASTTASHQLAGQHDRIRYATGVALGRKRVWPSQFVLWSRSPEIHVVPRAPSS